LGDGGGNQAVLLTFRVPVDAQVWIEGTNTTEQGSVRQFISPPLHPNRDYVYSVRVRYQRDGQEVDQTRNVIVRAGDSVQLNFTGQEQGYTVAPAAANGERAFYYVPEQEAAPGMLNSFYAPIDISPYGPSPRRQSYYGDTPGWGTVDTTGAGG
jgi:uncharacterized protein (TIGR03000 family)